MIIDTRAVLFIPPAICILLFIIAYKIRYSSKFGTMFYVSYLMSSFLIPAYLVVFIFPAIGIVITRQPLNTAIALSLFLFLLSKGDHLKEYIMYHDLVQFDYAVREYIFSTTTDCAEAESIYRELLPIVNDMLYTKYVRSANPIHDLPQVMLVVYNCCVVKLNNSNNVKKNAYTNIAKECLETLHDNGFIKNYIFDECILRIDRGYPLCHVWNEQLSQKISFH